MIRGQFLEAGYCPDLNNGTNGTLELYPHSCIQKLIKTVREIVRPLDLTVGAIFTICYVVLAILALFGNGLVIYAVLRKREMRTNRNVFITNLAFSNFLLALMLIPLLWVPALLFVFPYGSFLCKVANAFPGSNVFCSTLTISVMAIDRYYTIKSISVQVPNTHRRTFRAMLVAVGVWVVAFFLCVPLLILYHIDETVIFKDVLVHPKNVTISFVLQRCQMGQVRWVNIGVSIVQLSFLYIVPLVVLSLFNVKLTRFLNEQARNMAAMKAANKPSVGDQISLTAQKRSNTDRLEQASRRQSRTTYLMVAMAASYALLWLPFVVMTLMADLGVNSSTLRLLDEIAKLLSMTSICVNPFLYGYLNTNFQREFKEIFGQFVCATLPSRHNSDRKITETTYALMHINMHANGEREPEVVLTADGTQL